MSITRTAIVDDDGSLTTGTIWNNAYKQEVYDQIDAAIAADAVTHPASTAPTTTGTITAEPIPTGTGVLATYHNNATLKTIQGMVAGIHGQLWVHYSKGAGQVDFAHLHASGTALGKCKNFATSGNTPLAAGSGVAIYQYDATAGVTQWKLVTHEQGAWITPTFAAGNFTGNGSMTWTVDSGDVITMRYMLRGRTLTVGFVLNTTTVGGTPNTTLNIGNGQWGGFTAASFIYTPVALLADNGIAASARFTPSSTVLLVQRADLANFTASTNNTSLYGETVFDVT